MTGWNYRHTWGLALGLLAGAVVLHLRFLMDMASMAGVR